MKDNDTAYFFSSILKENNTANPGKFYKVCIQI